MNAAAIILIALIALALVLFGVLFRYMMPSGIDDQMSVLSGMRDRDMAATEVHRSSKRDPASVDIDKVLKAADSEVGTRKDDDTDVLYFRAGLFGARDREVFKRQSIAMLIAFPLIAEAGAFIAFGMNPLFLILAAPTGFMIARIAEDRRLRKRITSRHDEISYYLPMVIEQISIGVSSALDVGPCLVYVVDMASERGSHNVVTELLTQVLKLLRAGMSLEEALEEVGSIAGHSALKNSFVFLAQCSRYGGEISKQLRDLGAAVAREREIEIETVINGLPNKATVALAGVFAGVFIMIVTAIMTRVGGAVGGVLG